MFADRSRLIGRATSFSWKLAKPLLSLKQHLQALGPTLFCPVYHTVRENHPEWWGGRYRIKTPSEFEQDLDLLLGIADPVDLQQLLQWQSGLAEKPAGWFLSFDDGYRELYEVAAPILLRKGIPATFFVCSSLIDNRKPFFEDVLGLVASKMRQCSSSARGEVERVLSEHRSNLDGIFQSRLPQFDLLAEVTKILDIDIGAWLKKEEPYLSSEQINSLLKQGFTVGAHSVDHSLFAKISHEERQAQLESSVSEVTRQFRLDYRVFAFPYGEFGLSRDYLTSIRSEGLVDMCFGTRGIAVDELEPGLVQRMLAEGHNGTFGAHLKNELNLQLRRRSQGRAVVRRREGES